MAQLALRRPSSASNGKAPGDAPPARRRRRGSHSRHTCFGSHAFDRIHVTVVRGVTGSGASETRVRRELDPGFAEETNSLLYCAPVIVL
jgi:hypothetical protein